ncbi:MarR family transcriptional regulator [Kineosporia sp. J2-2]|uniref:MarR family transcriptional regulator n=1 Tax=Kineosporia corallincola TaxID=2835133 RepID=A0ABS5TBM2_9ACTN|nr:MarR family transcriptional regulator [Kineosporia corallincola]MBT0768477.1 MarR family transcriptional regulator [Kineosporia corallincola]
MDDEVPPFPAVLEPGPRLDLLDRLRSYAGLYAEMARLTARRLSLHTTDVNALVEVLWAERTGEPLTPARLAERVGLTSGATNALVNRLETAGYVTRSREHTDRRQVTLRATPTARERTEQIYTRPAELFEATFARLDPATVRAMIGAMDLLTATLAQVNAEMAAPAGGKHNGGEQHHPTRGRT